MCLAKLCHSESVPDDNTSMGIVMLLMYVSSKENNKITLIIPTHHTMVFRFEYDEH